ncbi:biotin/lipoyl-binding protein [Paenibacillus popilliae]|uniref:biotin/lipoyl-binding protein n=1 Tax=Paenibacillus popilliae TaxID=78057 RepID=UPI0021AFEFB0|nr:biotin/lipoyl-binding protein [Paenibacillus sp. SDF0028]
MGFQQSEQAAMGRKRTIRLVFGLFIGLLIGFTLFSNTLATLSLPKVVLALPSKGQLVHTFTGSGVLKWKAEARLSNNSGWKVEKVHVREGQLVKKGQPLVSYETEAAEQAIAAAKNALGISEIDLEIQERRIQKLQHDLKANGNLVAPFDGIITTIGATEGVPSGGAPDIVISNGSLGFEFEFFAPATMTASLQSGESLKVRVEGSRPLQVEGRIAYPKCLFQQSGQCSGWERNECRRFHEACTDYVEKSGCKRRREGSGRVDENNGRCAPRTQ